MCQINKGRSRGAPSKSVNSILQKKQNGLGHLSNIPLNKARLDKMDYFVIWSDTIQRCKYSNGDAKTLILCRKCQIYLCINKESNIFYIVMFHLWQM